MADEKPKSLEELTIILFPHTIIAEEFRELAAYICIEIPCELGYTEEIANRILPALGPQTILREVTSIHGSLTSTVHGVTLLPFSVTRKIVDEGSRYSHLVFQTTPGYDPEELPTS